MTDFKLSFDDEVAASATDIQSSAVVPNGKTVRVNKFGGSDRPTDGVGSWIVLQWGSGSTWDTIRAGSWGSFCFEVKRDFLGDGTKRLRLVRQNKSSTDKELFAFIEAVLL
jgi:hypothetical protein